MVLAPRERTGPRPTQRQLAIDRFRGTHPTPLPGPGAFARSQDSQERALLPSGAPAEDSVIDLGQDSGGGER
jgi:NADH-quinone oxidoreductase subunit J